MNTLRQSSTALPSFRRMAVAACTIGAIPVAFLLIAGNPWPAVSVALGIGISLGVCGLLFLFVERAMPLLTSTGSQGSQLQFLLLLLAKLFFISLIGAAFLSLHQVSPTAVLCGFMLGQSAIVVAALRFRKPNES